MVGFSEIEYNLWGMSAFGTTWLGRPLPIIDFDAFDAGEGVDDRIVLRSASGAINGFISFLCRDTIVESAYFEKDLEGCGAFEIRLNKLPKIPINNLSVIQFSFDSVPIFTGQITKGPTPGEYKKGPYVFSGNGLRERLKKCRITNPYKFSIFSVTDSGSDIIIQISGTFPGALGTLTGLTAIVKDSDQSQNNGTYEILSYTSNTITVLKPNGVTTTTQIGTVAILPEYWANSHLVSDVLKYNLENFLPANGIIGYDHAKIEETTGIYTLGANDYDGMEMEKFFDLIRKILDGSTGNLWQLEIDGEGDVHLFSKSLTVIDKYFVGYQITGEPNIKQDTNQIANSVSILRNKARESQGNGFRQAGLASDLTSIAKYDISEYQEEVPGYFSNATGQAYAEAILANRKDPSTTASIKDMNFKIYQFGLYGYVTSPDFFMQVLNECDSLTGWTSGVAITDSLDNQILVDGANSIKLEFDETAEGQTYIYDFPEKKILTNPRTILFWVRSNRPGVYCKFGIGSTSHTENQYEFEVSPINEFNPIAIDISDLALVEVGQIGFQFFNLLAVDYEFYIDFIRIEHYTALHYNLPLKKARYNLDSHRNYVDLTMGSPFANPTLAEFMAGLKGQIELTKLNLKE